jgi:hypothetical protein
MDCWKAVIPPLTKSNRLQRSSIWVSTQSALSWHVIDLANFRSEQLNDLSWRQDDVEKTLGNGRLKIIAAHRLQHLGYDTGNLAKLVAPDPHASSYQL